MKNTLTPRSILSGFTALFIGFFILSSCSQKTLPINPTDVDIQNEILDNDKETSDNQKENGAMLNARIWSSTSSPLTFPEDKLNLNKTGICMSGGGTRAMVCAVGQLKGLVKLGLIDNVGYISCVSGGSWASVPFTYYTEGAVDDNQLLGTIVPPGELTLNGMKTLEPGFLAGAANAPLLGNMLRDLRTTAPEDLWIKGVSKSYMQQYGLYTEGAPKYFSYDWGTVREICGRNTSLRPSDFVVVRNGKNDVHRPYLVVNSSISGQFNNAPFDKPEPLSVFNYTPLGVGAAVPLNPTFRSQSGEVNTGNIGGGFIEPFAFGAVAPSSEPIDCKNDALSKCVTLQVPSSRYTIADASGTSSSAYVATFTASKIFGHELRDMSPQEQYWKVPSQGEPLPTSENYMFGDGGNLENLGAITLIQRKVNKLIIFVNTDRKLNEKYDIFTNPTPTAKDVSSDILTLFGIVAKGSEDMYQNHIFPESDLNDMMAQFVEAKKNGHSVIAQTSHLTLKNDWWGIPANQKVDIVWVYNDNANDYLDQLEWEIKDQIKDLDGEPDFKHFPNYNTIGEKTGKLVELSPEQINLLYQFSAWTVYSNPEKFNLLKEK